MLQVVKWVPMRREEATIMFGGEEHMQAEVMTAEGPSATALHDSAGLVVAQPGIKTSVGRGITMKMMTIVMAMVAIN